MEVLHEINDTLDPLNGPSQQRTEQFNCLAQELSQSVDPIRVQMSNVMCSFKKGLFVAGDDPTLPRDNYDLERSFRVPKSHERHTHGRAHVGTRIVYRGATLLLVLDMHQRHPEPLSAEELRPWCWAKEPSVLLECRRRAQIMRKARSSKKRQVLLAELEARFQQTILAK